MTTTRDTLTPSELPNSCPVPPDDCRTFNLWQNGMIVASVTGEIFWALDSIRYYAKQYAEDGLVQIKDDAGNEWSEDDPNPRVAGIDAARRYLAAHPREKPTPTPWLALLVIVLIVAAIVSAVLKGMGWWQSIPLSLVMFAGMSMVFSGCAAEYGRKAGVVR